jgi:hypothetical protein
LPYYISCTAEVVAEVEGLVPLEDPNTSQIWATNHHSKYRSEKTKLVRWLVLLRLDLQLMVIKGTIEKELFSRIVFGFAVCHSLSTDTI